MPPSGPLTTPLLADDVTVADDGARLPLRVWLPKGKSRAMILAVHGFNDYSNAFAEPAKAWAEDGIATYAYDQRGFGEAPERGRWAGAAAARPTISRRRAGCCAARHPGVPLYLLGESMGGAVVIAARHRRRRHAAARCRRLILSAPAVWGRDTMNVFERAALWTGDALVPGHDADRRAASTSCRRTISRCCAPCRAIRWSSRRRASTAIKGLVDLMDPALAAAPQVTAPMLLLYGEHDEVMPPGATQHVDRPTCRYQARTSRRIALYADGYHMLLRDLEAPPVLRDIESWIADPRGAAAIGRRPTRQRAVLRAALSVDVLSRR